MDSGKGVQKHYKPIQRIARACNACRRKKARCTGNYPCENCARLSEVCRYSPRRETQRPSSVDKSSESLGSISQKLAGLEGLLRDFQRQLQGIVSTQERIAASIASAAQQQKLLGGESETQTQQGILPSPTDAVRSWYSIGSSLSAQTPKNDDGCLPTPVLESTIDAYFRHCHNQPYSFFHEANFRRKCSEGAIPDHLLLAILANAVRFSTESFFGEKLFDFAVAFANQSWKSIVSTCFASNRSADLHTVQTVTLLSIFDFTAGRSRHGSAWVKIGMAVRIAQDLKLMLCQHTHMPHSVQEEHRRVFWSIYLLDRLVSCGRGRPPAILDASCQLQLPFDERKWREGLWEKTLTLKEASDHALVNNSTHGPFARVIMIAQILGRTAQYMLQECNFRNRYPPWEATSDFAATESDLLLLETHFQMRLPLREEVNHHRLGVGSIDQASVGPIIFSRALFHLCYCILHHPFLLRKRIRSCQMSVPPSFLVRTFASGRQHANSLARHINSAREMGCYVQASFYGYCAVVSGSIAGLNAHSTDEETRSQALLNLQENIAFLEDLSRHWANGSLLLTALKKCIENGYKFRSLSEDSTIDPGLGAEDEDLLWSLVDYSTMSNAAPTQAAENSDAQAQLNSSTSWYELFSSSNWSDIDVFDHDFLMGVDEVEEDRSTVTASG